MNAARRLVLENRNGQTVRSFASKSEEMSLIYRHDTRRVELHSDLKTLVDAEVSFQILKNLTITALKKSPVAVPGVGPGLRSRTTDVARLLISPRV